MTTLGFGDITFTSDIGRLFSILVLLSGVVLLLVMRPFMFISLFYAPWLEARVRLRGRARCPRPRRGRTYERTNATAARMLLANCEDTVNTNITITAREIAAELPIVAIVEEEDSIDVVHLSGATTVLPLKHQLGEYLANRTDTGVYPGDAADRRVLERAGIGRVSSVLLTTNDDAMARLRAGRARGRGGAVLNRSAAVAERPPPRRFRDRVGHRHERGGARARRHPRHQPHRGTRLESGAVLVMLGSLDRRRRFAELFET